MKYKNGGSHAIHFKINDKWEVVQPGQEYDFASDAVAERNGFVVSEQVVVIPKPKAVPEPIKKKR